MKKYHGFSFMLGLLCCALLLPVPAAHALVQFEAASQAIGTNGTPRTITIPIPTGTASGDVLIASMSVRWYQATVTPPAGWTAIQDTPQSSGAGTCNSGTTAGIRTLTYYKVAGSGETAPTFTYSSNCNDDGFAAAGMLRFSGVDTTSPIITSAEATTGSSTTHQAPSVSSGTETDTMLVTVHSYGSSRSWSTSPTGMTERIDQRSYGSDNVLGVNLGVFTQSIAAAGATGTRTATGAGDADFGATQSILLRMSSIDLAMAISRSGALTPSATASYTLSVSNIGSATHSGTVTVVDTLPTGLTYTGYSGTGWTCTAAPMVGPGTITCTSSDAIAGGGSANDITLNVSVAAVPPALIINSVTVTAAMTESSTANNTASDTYGSGTTGSCTTTTVGSDTVITCTGDGTITLPSNVSEVRYLVVGGGGGGGGIVSGNAEGAGGGGAGGVLSGVDFAVTAGATYNVTVGASGTAGTGSTKGGTGGSSTFSTLTALGGGGGAWAGNTVGTTGNSGASGGGGSDGNNGGAGTQGNNGGNGNGNDGGGGGGGAGAAGADGTGSTGGNGGDGVTDDITGGSTYYGGGGGGGTDDGASGTGGAGGLGGGGSALSARGAGTAGTANTGGGGGGASGSGSGSAFDGGTGGTGIVVIRYPTAGTPVCVTFRDEFTTQSYSRNDGTANWAGNWTETNDDGSAASGTLNVNSGELQLVGDGSGSTGSFGGPAVQREANLSSYTGATLSFDYRETGSWESGDTMTVFVSNDGGSNWTQLHQFSNDQGATAQTLSLDVTSYISSNFRVAFVEGANGGAEIFYIDNIQVEACGSSGPDHLEIQSSGSGLTCAASTLTIKACTDTAVPCVTPYTGGVSGTLSASGAPTVNWDGTTGGAAGAGFVIPGSSSSVTKSVQVATAGTVTFGVGTATPTPTGTTTCNFGTNSPSNNNCVFTASTAGFLFSNSPTGTAYTLPAQVSGVASSQLYLRALQASTTNPAVCTPAIIGQTTDVTMGYTCNNPAACQPGNLATINATAIASGGTAVSLSFDGNGSAPITARYDDAGQITLNASKTVTPFGGATPVALTGSSNAFVVKPDHFVLSAIQQTALPNLANPGAADATGAKFVKAGEAFSVTVTAKNALGGTTLNFGQESSPESVKLTSALVAGLGLTNNPAPGGSFGAFTNGVATGTNFTWNEVGIITLTPSIADGDYLGAGDVSGTTSGNVGRFYAAQFALSGGVIANRTALSGCAAPAGCGTFTYMGEEMSAVFSLTAKATDGTTTLQNYRYSATAANNFAKLDPTAGANPLALAAVDTGTPRTVATLDTTTYGNASGNFTNGVADITAPFAVTRGGTPSSPFEALDVGVVPVDGDGATLGVLDLAVNVAGAPNTHGLVNSTKARYGRMKISNAHGSELLPLPIDVVMQYWNGTAYVTNMLDDHSTFAATDVTLGNYQVNLALGETSVVTPPASVVFTDGVARYQLTAPGNGNNGSVDMTVSVLSAWLPGNTARATFGVYKGSNELIYLRESY